MKTPPPKELLKKIQELEAGHANFRVEMFKLMLSGGAHHRRVHSVSPPAPHHRCRENEWKKESSSPPQVGGRTAEIRNLSERQCLNVLQSVGQSVHIMDLQNRVTLWNRSAEILYGYSAAEALGQNLYSLLVDHRYVDSADSIVNRVWRGESWTGQFPVRHKKGHKLLVVATNTPFHDDDGTLVGVICVSHDSKPFMESKVSVSERKKLEDCLDSNKPNDSFATKVGLDTEQPLQITIALKLTNLASKVSDKVWSKFKTGENNVVRAAGSGDSGYSDRGFSDVMFLGHREDESSSGASTPRGELGGLPHGVFTHFSAGKSFVKIQNDSSDESEGRSTIHKLKSKAEAWIGKKAMQWSLKGNEQETSEGRSGQFNWPCNQCEQDSDRLQSVVKLESNSGDFNRPAANEASGSWSSFNNNSTSSASSYGSGSSSSSNKVDVDTDCSDYEIMWEDLTIGEQIGQGSCGIVYHGLWYGSDVAIKVFSKQEYSEDVRFSFRQEVCLMKRLRHPNILLFMGAVMSPQRLCIITEFLPRGSLFRLLQRSTAKLDWRRKILMAVDIAQGMNYLHNCSPPIVHRDLKTSNLLVDKNWMVKVADFGLSRVKHETYLTTKSGKGTPQWMAPEVLRYERSDEKSDIYSFGIILWELATQKVPWEHLNAMQVIGAVGFMNQRLDIPEDVDSRWASIIESCWHSDPQTRPTFQELLEKLKDLQRQYAIQFRAAKASSAEILKEL